MRKWKANGYVLSMCILVSEYVRQHQEDAGRGAADDSLASLRDGGPETPPAAVSKSSLNALALFLCDEIQHPATDPSVAHSGGFTTLLAFLRRLERAIPSETDFAQLSSVLVHVLSEIDSPDAVGNVVDRIAECVAPLEAQGDDEEEDTVDVDSANATLVRTSLLGVFVRSFLLAVNRLLFDGLSRLYDDVAQYLGRYREESVRAQTDKQRLSKQAEKQPREGHIDDSNLELPGSPHASQYVWEEGKESSDDLLLSPIRSGTAVSFTKDLSASSHVSTPIASIPAPGVNTEDAEDPVGPPNELSDAAMWSDDQLSFVLSDTVRDLERGRGSVRGARSGTAGNTGSSAPGESLRLLHVGMDEANPNVLFVKYLSFLHGRDYQGALDSLHQYHDVLPSRQDPRLNSNGGDASASTTAGSTGGAGLHFRGTGVQYAALNLAGLQIQFAHYAMAQESIQEAIRVAQHHGDHICVAFALSWLIRINQKLGKSKDAVLALVGSCLERAEELMIPSLEILAALTEAECELTRSSTRGAEALGVTSQLLPHVLTAQTPSPRPLHVWSRLQDTTRAIASVSTPVFVGALNNNTQRMSAVQSQMNNHRMMASGANPSERSGTNGSGMAWMKSTEAILDTVWQLSGKVTISTAVAWSLFGQRTLGQVFSRIHLLCYEDAASVGEIALTVSRMAMSELPHVHSGEQAYPRALGLLVDVATDPKCAAARCHLLDQAPFQRTLHNLLFLWALQRGEFARAKSHLSALLTLSPSGNDFPAHLEALVLKARFWAAIGDYPRSLALLEKLPATCSELGFAYLHARVLIATTQTRFRAAAPHAPFASLNTLLIAMGICKTHHYDLLLAEAHVIMAEMYLSMGKLQDAHSLLNDQMPLVMEHGSVQVRGECLLVLAKIMVASINNPKEGAAEPSAAASKVIELLNASAEMQSSLQDLGRLKEISYIKSLVYNHIAAQGARCNSDVSKFCELREKAAADFLKYGAQLKQAASLSLESFFDLESPESIRKVVNHRAREYLE